MPTQILIIGSGFSGLSAACFLQKRGYQVTVLEKHAIPGGRARQLSAEGFTFDMGPSWYWMPDVFDTFFGKFGKKVSDYYHLHRLDPSYKVVWQDGTSSNIPANYTELQAFFESKESGAGQQLDAFMQEAAYKYKVGIQKLVYKPGQSITEFIDLDLIKGLFRLDVFANMKVHVRKYFQHPHLQQLMEFPVLFLGALPEKTPALYSLMNYADMVGGTWFPQGGMYKIVEGMYTLAQELGVQFQLGANVTEIVVNNGVASQVKYTQNGESKTAEAKVVVASADYHHVETKLLAPQYQSYSAKYWDTRTMAPSCLLYYVGINKQIPQVPHHTLYFDADFGLHGKEIYETKTWPTNPLFYVSRTTATDSTGAPEGFDNLFFLIPVATGLQGDTEEVRDKYFSQILQRFEQEIGEKIEQNIVYKKSFAQSDFISDYNAFKGNAYGLANTLLQTAILKPACKSKKVKNLFYTGQLTVPGPGVPPSLISGEVVAGEIQKSFPVQ